MEDTYLGIWTLEVGSERIQEGFAVRTGERDTIRGRWDGYIYLKT